MNIEEVRGQITRTFIDWSSFLRNLQVVRKGNSITWSGRETRMLEDQVLASDVIKLSDDEQYTFQVATDGSVFQIYYQYDKKGNTLQSARLAFYSAQGDSPVGWLRIDYEPALAKGILHHDCHMHLSAFPQARCVVAGVPNPQQFVEFVMAVCYPETYEAHRLGQDGEYANPNKASEVNSRCFSAVEHLAYKQIIHLRIPTS